MKHLTQSAIVLGGTALLAATPSLAFTTTNTATNIATVAEACDIVAIGTDLGLVETPVEDGAAAGTGSNVNNTTHVKGGEDGTAGSNPDQSSSSGNDTLALNTGLPDPAATTINDAVSGIAGNAAGIYVACTSTPDAVRIYSANAGTGTNDAANKLSLGIATNATAQTFTGMMLRYTDASTSVGTDTLGYTLDYTVVVTDTSGLGVPLVPALYLGVYAVGASTVTSANSSNGGQPPAGDYADVSVAEVEF